MNVYLIEKPKMGVYNVNLLTAYFDYPKHSVLFVKLLWSSEFIFCNNCIDYTVRTPFALTGILDRPTKYTLEFILNDELFCVCAAILRAFDFVDRSRLPCVEHFISSTKCNPYIIGISLYIWFYITRYLHFYLNIYIYLFLAQTITDYLIICKYLLMLFFFKSILRCKVH